MSTETPESGLTDVPMQSPSHGEGDRPAKQLGEHDAETIGGVIDFGNEILEKHVPKDALLILDPSMLPDELKALMDSEQASLGDKDVQSHVVELIVNNEQTRKAVLGLLRTTGNAELADGIQVSIDGGKGLDTETLRQLEQSLGMDAEKIMGVRERLEGLLKGGGVAAGKKPSKELRQVMKDIGSGTTIRNEKKDVGRNSKCPCGSGKKYKQCCLRKQ